MLKLDLTTHAELLLWFSKCQYVVVNVQQCSLLMTGRPMLYLHTDIFLTGIKCYDWLKFSQIYTPKHETPGTPWLGHRCDRDGQYDKTASLAGPRDSVTEV